MWEIKEAVLHFPSSKSCLPFTMHFSWCIGLWCVAVLISYLYSSLTDAPWFTVLLLFHTDNLFTPHQRRLLWAEQRLSALSNLLSTLPSLCALPFFPPHARCIPSLVQSPRNFLRCVRNKHPSFCVSCISLFCPFLLSFQCLLILEWC